MNEYSCCEIRPIKYSLVIALVSCSVISSSSKPPPCADYRKAYTSPKSKSVLNFSESSKEYLSNIAILKLLLISFIVVILLDRETVEKIPNYLVALGLKDNFQNRQLLFFDLMKKHLNQTLKHLDE